MAATLLAWIARAIARVVFILWRAARGGRKLALALTSVRGRRASASLFCLLALVDVGDSALAHWSRAYFHARTLLVRHKVELLAGINPNWLVANWFVDPGNFSGCASDGNDCQHAVCAGVQGPCATYGEIGYGRWGTWQPVLAQATTMTQLSAYVSIAAAKNDPFPITPIIKNGGSLSVIGALNAGNQKFSGTITVTSSKVRATPTELIINSLSAGDSGDLVINATHPSRLSLANSTGAVAGIGQPLLNTQSMAVIPTEVDTWTTGDSVTEFQPYLTNIVDIEPIIEDGAATGTPILVAQLELGIAAGVAGAYETLRVRGPVLIADAQTDRNIDGVSQGQPGIRLTNVFENGSVNLTGLTASQQNFVDCAPNTTTNYAATQCVTVWGGSTNGGISIPQLSMRGGWIDFDTRIMDSTIVAFEGTNFYGCVEPNGGRLRGANAYMFPNHHGACTVNSQIWGAGVVYADGMTRWSYSGQTATNTFLTGIGIDLNALATTGCSHSNANNPDVINCAIALNVANLDAAQGIAGFGGLAFLPGGSSFTSSR